MLKCVPEEAGSLYASVETRWFYEGQCRDEIFEWFHSGSEEIEEQERTDCYLMLPETDSLGAKLRGQESVELKLRTAILPVIEVKGADGQRERWHKWSLPVADGDLSDLRLDPWIAVHKHRWTRHYAVMDDGRQQAVAPDAHPAEGCKFELTFLVANDTEWWSLGFEGFGAEAHLMRNFDAVARMILDGKPLPIPLERGCSYGYPRWLRRVHRP